MGKEGSSTAGGGVGAHTPQAMAVLIRIVSLHLPVVPAMTRRRQLMYTFYIARDTVITGPVVAELGSQDCSPLEQAKRDGSAS